MERLALKGRLFGYFFPFFNGPARAMYMAMYTLGCPRLGLFEISNM
jgi:hypothetical protein